MRRSWEMFSRIKTTEENYQVKEKQIDDRLVNIQDKICSKVFMKFPDVEISDYFFSP